MRGQDASPGIPARWMTAAAPWQAAVIASRSVTEAWIVSSPGPAVSGARSSRRSVRSGRASRGRSMDPTRPAAPVMTTTDTGPPPIPSNNRTYWPAAADSSQVTSRYQVAHAPFLSGVSGLRLEVLMGLTRGSLTRGSLTLPRMNAHRLVIIAAALTTVVAAALATALATFSGQALPRAVRHDLGHATGTSLSVSGSVNASQAAQYTSILPSQIKSALGGTPFGFYQADWSDPLGFVPGALPATPSAAGTGNTQIAEAAALGDVTGQAELTSGHWPGAPVRGQPIPAALPATAAALLHVSTGDVLRMRDRISQGYVRFVVTGLYRPRQVSAAYWNLSEIAPSGSSTAGGFTTFGPLTVQPAAFAASAGGLPVNEGTWLAEPQTASIPADQLTNVAANVNGLRAALANAQQLPSLTLTTSLPAVLAGTASDLDVARSLLAICAVLLFLLAAAALLAAARLLAGQREGES